MPTTPFTRRALTPVALLIAAAAAAVATSTACSATTGNTARTDAAVASAAGPTRAGSTGTTAADDAVTSPADDGSAGQGCHLSAAEASSAAGASYSDATGVVLDGVDSCGYTTPAGTVTILVTQDLSYCSDLLLESEGSPVPGVGEKASGSDQGLTVRDGASCVTVEGPVTDDNWKAASALATAVIGKLG